jgi:hypothetical protein
MKEHIDSALPYVRSSSCVRVRVRACACAFWLMVRCTHSSARSRTTCCSVS